MTRRHSADALAAALKRVGDPNPQDVAYSVEADKRRGGFRVVLTAQTPEEFPGARGVWHSGSSRLRMDGRRRWVHTAMWVHFDEKKVACEALHAALMELDAQYAADHKAAAEKARREAAYQVDVQAYQAPVKALRAEFLVALEAAGIAYEANPRDPIGAVRVSEALWCPHGNNWFPSAPPEAEKLPDKFRADWRKA